MTDSAYVAAARKTLRRSLFRRFKTTGMDLDKVMVAVATAEQAALSATNLNALASVAASAGEMAAALEAADPLSPALVSFTEARESAPDLVRDVFTHEP